MFFASAIQYDVRIAISEYWISHLYDNSTETFQHAAKSLESQVMQFNELKKILAENGLKRDAVKGEKSKSSQIVKKQF